MPIPNHSNYEEDLTTLLLSIAVLEIEIEKMRCNLCENDKFLLDQAFSTLDKYRNGHVTTKDIRSFFGSHQIPILERECNFIIFTYATNFQNGIDFKDYLRIVLPASNAILRDQCLQRRPGKYQQNFRCLPFYIEEQFSRLLEMELQFFRHVEKSKMDLMNTYGWNVLDAFRIIDSREKGYLVYKDFDVLFQRNSKPFTKFHYDAMMRRLDKDANDQITKNEFCDALLPMDFSGTISYEENLEKEFYDLIRGPASKLNYVTEDQQDIWNKMGGENLGVYEEQSQQRKFLHSVLPPSSNNVNSEQNLRRFDDRSSDIKQNQNLNNSPIKRISHYQDFQGNENIPNFSNSNLENSLNRNSTKKRVFDPLTVNSARGSPMKPYKISPSNIEPLDSIQKEGTTNKPHQTPYAHQQAQNQYQIIIE